MVNILLDLPLSRTHLFFFLNCLHYLWNFVYITLHAWIFHHLFLKSKGRAMWQQFTDHFQELEHGYNSMSKICVYSNFPRCSPNVLCIFFSRSGSDQGADIAFSYVCFESGSVSRSVVSNSSLPHGSPPGSSVHGIRPGENTGVGSHSLLQRIFPTQGSNPGLLHCIILWATSPLICGSSLSSFLPRLLLWGPEFSCSAESLPVFS